MSARKIRSFKNTYPSGKATTEEGARKLWQQYLDTLEDPKNSKKKPQDFYEKPKEESGSDEKNDNSESKASEETVQALKEIGTTPTEPTISEEKAKSFVGKFLEKAKNVSKGMAKVIQNAPLSTKQFITDTEFRNKALKKSAKVLRDNSSIIAKAIWDSTKSESIDFARPFTAPVTVAKRLKNGERPLLTKDEKFSLYSGLVYWGCIVGSYSLSHMGTTGASHQATNIITATKQIGNAALNSVTVHIVLGAVVNGFQAYFKKDPKKNMPNKAQIEQGIKDSELTDKEKEDILSELVNIQDNPNKLFLFFEQIENTALYFQIATGTNFLKEMGVTFGTGDLYGIIGADAFKNLFGKAADVITKLGAEDKAKIKEYEGYVNDFADALEATTDDDIIQALESNGDCILKGTKDLVKGMGKEEKKEKSAETKKAMLSKMARSVAIEYLSRQSAYTEKKKITNQDGDESTVYVYSDEHIKKRHKEKSKKIEKLRKCMSDLRSKYRRDIDSEDKRKGAIALAVSLIDLTYERVGNPTSAENGHFGITGLQKRHIKFANGKATLSYVGKSGVKQTKEISDEKIISKLKEMTKKKLKDEHILTYGDDRCVSARLVNAYLKDFGISAKDIRGFHANEEMKKALKSIRKENGKLPSEEKDKAKQLKTEFKTALKQVASIVGHQHSTLKNQYLVPHLEETFLEKGKVITSLKTATKSQSEKEDEQVEDIHKKNPKERPPRYDLRKRRIEEDDEDLDTTDKDLSLKHEDYKRASLEDRVAMMWLFGRYADGTVNAWNKRLKRVTQVQPETLKNKPELYEPYDSDKHGGTGYAFSEEDAENAMEEDKDTRVEEDSIEDWEQNFEQVVSEIQEMPNEEYQGNYQQDRVDTEFFTNDILASQYLLNNNLTDKEKSGAKDIVSNIKKKLAGDDWLNATNTLQTELLVYSIGALRSLEKDKNGNVPSVEDFTKALKDDPERAKTFFTMAYGEDIGNLLSDEDDSILFNGGYDDYVDNHEQYSTDSSLEETCATAYKNLLKKKEMEFSDEINKAMQSDRAEPVLSESSGNETLFFDLSSEDKSENKEDKSESKEEKVEEIDRTFAKQKSENPILQEQIESLDNLDTSLKEKVGKSMETAFDTYENIFKEGTKVSAKDIKSIMSNADPSTYLDKNGNLKEDVKEEDFIKANENKLIVDMFLTDPDMVGSVKDGEENYENALISQRVFQQVLQYDETLIKKLEDRINDEMSFLSRATGKNLLYSEMKAKKDAIGTHRVLSGAKSGMVKIIMENLNMTDQPLDKQPADRVNTAFEQVKDYMTMDTTDRKELVRENLRNMTFEEMEKNFKSPVFKGWDKLTMDNPTANDYVKEFLVDFAAEFESEEDYENALKTFNNEKKDSKSKSKETTRTEKKARKQEYQENFASFLEELLTIDENADFKKIGRINDLLFSASENGNKISDSVRKSISSGNIEELSSEEREIEEQIVEVALTKKNTEVWKVKNSDKWGAKNKNGIFGYFDDETQANNFATKTKTSSTKSQSFIYNSMNIDSGLSISNNSTHSNWRDNIMSKINKQSALKVSGQLDRIASLFENSFKSLGVPEKIAKDFAFRCDLLSDTIEQNFGVEKKALDSLDPVLEPGFNPDDIGREVGGPLEDNGEHSWQDGEFSRQEHRELRDLQESGSISNVQEDPRAPIPGKQAKEEEKEEKEDKSDESSKKDKEMEKKQEELEEQRENHKQSALEDAISRLSKKADMGSVAKCSSLRDHLKICCVKMQESGVASVKSLASACDKLVVALDKIKEECIKAEALGSDSMELDMSCAKACGAVEEILPFMQRLCGSIGHLDQGSPVAQFQVEEMLEQSSAKLEKLVGLAVKIVADALSELSSAKKEEE